ncbi:MAG: Na+/H+ antiporter subunit E [Clostridia bacterium]
MFISLFLVWIILNGKITVEITIIGVILAAGISFFAAKIFGLDLKKYLNILKIVGFSFIYLSVLFWEIIKANINVTKVIFAKERHPDAVIVTINPGLKTESAQAVLANSITLTPGTITLDVKDGIFTVHCLKREFADGLKDWILLRMLLKLENKNER